MARKYEFSESVKEESRLRQMELCAHCGDCLNDEWEEAHHAVPDQCGAKSDNKYDWMRTALNCVVLCDPCHAEIGHNGNTRTGTVAGPAVYKYSHGGDAVRHKEWVRILDIEAAKIWGDKLGGSGSK